MILIFLSGSIPFWEIVSCHFCSNIWANRRNELILFLLRSRRVDSQQSPSIRYSEIQFWNRFRDARRSCGGVWVEISPRFISLHLESSFSFSLFSFSLFLFFSFSLFLSISGHSFILILFRWCASSTTIPSYSLRFSWLWDSTPLVFFSFLFSHSLSLPLLIVIPNNSTSFPSYCSVAFLVIFYSMSGRAYQWESGDLFVVGMIVFLLTGFVHFLSFSLSLSRTHTRSFVTSCIPYILS